MRKKPSFVILLAGAFLALILLPPACSKGGPTVPGLLLVDHITLTGLNGHDFWVGETTEIFATVYLSDGSSLTITDGDWSSSDPGVATVDGHGCVTMVGVGTARIVLTYQEATGFTNINVRGPDPDFRGTWTGTYSIETCNASGDFLAAGFCGAHTGSGLPIEMTLSQEDHTEVSGTIVLGEFSATLGSILGGWMGGLAQADPYKILIETDFQISEPGQMVGTFYLFYTAASSTGSGELTCRITSLRRTGP